MRMQESENGLFYPVSIRMVLHLSLNGIHSLNAFSETITKMYAYSLWWPNDNGHARYN